MFRPTPTRIRGIGDLRLGSAGLALAAAALLAGGIAGCSRRPSSTVLLATDLFEVQAQPLALDERNTLEWTLRHGGQVWSIRTRVPELARWKDLQAPDARAVLGGLVTWADPFLFVREDTGHREGSRAVVDHVFKCTEGKVVRLGTLAAPKEAPGNQFAGGRFRDAYDRLEFSPLAAPEKGPVFDIFLAEQSGRFRVDTEVTWARAEERYRKCLEQLRSSPGAATGTASTTAVAARSTKATALFCLALARYCRKDAAFEEARTLAERALGPLDELLEEVETVTPGELAPSRDEVLRANPALVNLFKESTDQPAEEPETPGSPGLVPLPSSIATP